MWSLIVVSNNVHATDVNLTGLCCSILFLGIFLNNGIIVASFHSERTSPYSSDNISTFPSGLLIYSTVCLRNCGGIHQLQVIYYISSS